MLRITLGLACCLMASEASGVVVVDLLDGAAASSVVVDPSTNDVTILGASTGTYRVYAQPRTESIGTITISGVAPSAELTLLVAGPLSAEVDNLSPLDPAGEGLAGISLDPLSEGVLTAQVSIAGSIFGDVGSAVLGSTHIVRIDASDDIHGDVQSSVPGTECRVICRDLIGTVAVVDSRLEELSCRSVLGEINIISSGGGAGSAGILQAEQIGAPGAPASIMFSGDVDYIAADKIYLDANALQAAEVGRIETLNGDLVGELTLGGIQEQIRVRNGDAQIKLTMSEGLAASSKVVIDGGLSPITPADLVMSFGNAFSLSDRLAGQVVVNAMNNGSTWEGNVNVRSPAGPITFSRITPEGVYNVLADDIGGGCIGIVPFPLSEPDTVPGNGDNFEMMNEVPDAALMFHYGPVESVGANGPILVERKPSGTGAWVSINASCVTFMPDGVRTHVMQVVPDGGFVNGYTYRLGAIRDLAGGNGLRCSIDDEPTEFVREYPEYTFSIGNDCPLDVNGNGIVGFGDLNTILANWGSTCFYPGDVNNDGDVNFADLELLLENWEMLCEESLLGAGASPSSLAKGSTGICPAVTDLGFACHDSFCATLSSCTEPEAQALIEALKALTDLYLEQE